MAGLIVLGVIVFIIIDIGGDRHRLTSLGGMFFFVFITFITSTNPAKVITCLSTVIRIEIYFGCTPCKFCYFINYD